MRVSEALSRGTCCQLAGVVGNKRDEGAGHKASTFIYWSDIYYLGRAREWAGEAR